MLCFCWGPEAQKLFGTGPWPQNVVRDFILIVFCLNHACVILFILREFKRWRGLPCWLPVHCPLYYTYRHRPKEAPGEIPAVMALVGG